MTVILMSTRNGKYSEVRLSDTWTDTSVDDAEVAIAMDGQVIWGEIAARSPEFNDKVASFAAPAMVLPLTKVSISSPSKPPEPRHWSPTQQEVDAYVNSLESEISQEGLHLRQRRVAQRGALALVPMPRLSNYSGLFWCAVAAAIACVWWLSLLFG